jgi:geranylgeranyl pyrophosphate synthase
LAAALLAHAPGVRADDTPLSAALATATTRPGRLLRARLVFEAACLHARDERLAEQLACAVEYFHLASLILDDLPCMDDAETRRGQPCLHRTYGEANSILASLALINRAYALVGLAFAPLDADVRLRATACLDACLGPAGVLGGQAADLQFSRQPSSARQVASIAFRKTGSLFWLAIFLPALLADPTAAEAADLRALCVYWGLAYQTLDDLRDVYSKENDVGKTTGRDRALGRPNLALAAGVPAARGRVQRLVSQAERTVARLCRLDPRWNYLEHFHRQFFQSEIVAQRTDTAGVAA